MDIRDTCESCGSVVETVAHQMANGDQIVIGRCEREGLYAVVQNGEVILPSMYGGEHELGKSSVKLPNGDRLELESCALCGFYAMEPAAELVRKIR